MKTIFSRVNTHETVQPETIPQNNVENVKIVCFASCKLFASLKKVKYLAILGVAKAILS